LQGSLENKLKKFDPLTEAEFSKVATPSGIKDLGEVHKKLEEAMQQYSERICSLKGLHSNDLLDEAKKVSHKCVAISVRWAFITLQQRSDSAAHTSLKTLWDKHSAPGSEVWPLIDESLKSRVKDFLDLAQSAKSKRAKGTKSGASDAACETESAPQGASEADDAKEPAAKRGRGRGRGRGRSARA
jgi:hypothetical protein